MSAKKPVKKTIKKVVKDVADLIDNKAKGEPLAELNTESIEDSTMQASPTQITESIEDSTMQASPTQPEENLAMNESQPPKEEISALDYLAMKKEDEINRAEEDKKCLIYEIKNLRERTDWMQQVFSGSEHLHSDSFKKSLAKSRAWLGKMLGVVGSANPYDVKVTSPKDIPVATDTVKDSKRIESLQKNKREFGMLGQLDAILEAREGLQSFCDAIDNLNIECMITGADLRKASICQVHAWTNLCEANFELGYLLSTLRK